MAGDSSSTEFSLNPNQIPESRTVNTEYDIPLDKDDFLFNGGHTVDIAKTGMVTKENLYKVLGEIDAPAVYSVIDLSTVTSSDVYRSNKIPVAKAVIQSIGDEFRTTDLDSVLDLISHYKSKLAGNDVPEAKRAKFEATVKKFESRSEKIGPRNLKMALAASRFINSLSEDGIDVESIPNYESTIGEIRKIMKNQ